MGKRPGENRTWGIHSPLQPTLCYAALPRNVSPTLQTKSFYHIILFYFLHSIYYYLQTFSSFLVFLKVTQDFIPLTVSLVSLSTVPDT